MITGRDSSEPRKAYLREMGSGFKSSEIAEVSQVEAASAITVSYTHLTLPTKRIV